VYRLSYNDGWAAGTGVDRDFASRTEYFRTEYEALNRARELIDSGVHHAISLCDSTGSVLSGVRLQLKLAQSAVE
jgi:hypothetical protein